MIIHNTMMVSPSGNVKLVAFAGVDGQVRFWKMASANDDTGIDKLMV